MRVGLFTDALAQLPLEDVLDWLERELPAVKDVEIGTGGYSPAPHCDLEALLADTVAARAWLAAIEERGFRLAALNVNGNPLEEPGHDTALRATIELASTLDVDTVACMSGGRPELTGGPWFPGVEKAIELYWHERVLPYWRKLAKLAAAERPSLRLCLELEPGSAGFNVSTAERLLALAPNIAVNVDPSHFFWQGIDPLTAIERLCGRIGFAHGKDTVIGERAAVDGVLDRGSWRYATVGHGHDLGWWSRFVDALAAAGYDEVVSIEHEDEAVAATDGISESVRTLLRATENSRVHA
jgi:sugar phosphate isomerase/epimerase